MTPVEPEGQWLIHSACDGSWETGPSYCRCCASNQEKVPPVNAPEHGNILVQRLHNVSVSAHVLTSEQVDFASCQTEHLTSCYWSTVFTEHWLLDYAWSVSEVSTVSAISTEASEVWTSACVDGWYHG